MVQWQNATFPRLRHGSDSRYPLQNEKRTVSMWSVFVLFVILAPHRYAR